ncbi:enoyl-CoA hydratase [Burkholderia pseudomallei]|nr:enoyl-CoA hydratase [Burkholderia pseudomallei]
MCKWPPGRSGATRCGAAPDFDCQEGGRQLLKAFREHDANLDAYREQSRHVLDSVSIYNAQNVAAYTEAIAALIEQTADWIAKARAGAEAREGVASFLEKRTPSWRA